MDTNREPPPDDHSPTSLVHSRRRCCSFFPCFDSSSAAAAAPSWWQSVRTVEIGAENSLWARGVSAFMKIREWSELVAGPRWKTFIRRFNRSRSGNSSNKHGNNFQYDPLSYAMNFDEGQSGHFVVGEEEDYYASRHFSSRYAKGSIELPGPTSVV